MRDGERTESELTRRLCDCLRRCNCKVIAVVGGEMQEAGLPDRFVAHRELPGGVWLEMKRDRNPLTGKQREVLRSLSERGCRAAVLRWLSGARLLALQDFDGRVLGTLDARRLVGEPGERGYAVVRWLREVLWPEEAT